MKLSQKLLLAVLPVLGLVLSLGGWLLIRQDFTASLAGMQRQAETEQLRERSALQAELLSADVDPVLYLPEYGAAVDRYTAASERAFALFSDSGGAGLLGHAAAGAAGLAAGIAGRRQRHAAHRPRTAAAGT